MCADFVVVVAIFFGFSLDCLPALLSTPLQSFPSQNLSYPFALLPPSIAGCGALLKRGGKLQLILPMEEQTIVRKKRM